MASPVVLAGLPPVTNADTRVLVLGSFPGEASLRAAQYYAHPQNQFWLLMGQVLGTPLQTLSYETRLSLLLDHGIGVWDVIRGCRRRGSLDSEIRDAAHNDFTHLRRECPGLLAVFFNGKMAARSASALAAMGLATYVLPSSSPAYTLPLEKKAQDWSQIRSVLSGLAEREL